MGNDFCVGSFVERGVQNRGSVGQDFYASAFTFACAIAVVWGCIIALFS